MDYHKNCGGSITACGNGIDDFYLICTKCLETEMDNNYIWYSGIDIFQNEIII